MIRLIGHALCALLAAAPLGCGKEGVADPTVAAACDRLGELARAEGGDALETFEKGVGVGCERNLGEEKALRDEAAWKDFVACVEKSDKFSTAAVACQLPNR